MTLSYSSGFRLVLATLCSVNAAFWRGTARATASRVPAGPPGPPPCTAGTLCGGGVACTRACQFQALQANGTGLDTREREGTGGWGGGGGTVRREPERTGSKAQAGRSADRSGHRAGPERQLRGRGRGRGRGAGRRSSTPSSYPGTIVSVRGSGGPEGALLCPRCALRIPSSSWASHIGCSVQPGSPSAPHAWIARGISGGRPVR